MKNAFQIVILTFKQDTNKIENKWKTSEKV